MTHAAVDWALQQDCSGNEKVVLAELASRLNRHGVTAWPSAERLERLTQCGERQRQRLIRRLEERGLALQIPGEGRGRGKGRGPVVYVLAFDPVAGAPCTVEQAVERWTDRDEKNRAKPSAATVRKALDDIEAKREAKLTGGHECHPVNGLTGRHSGRKTPTKMSPCKGDTYKEGTGRNRKDARAQGELGLDIDAMNDKLVEAFEPKANVPTPDEVWQRLVKSQAVSKTCVKRSPPTKRTPALATLIGIYGAERTEEGIRSFFADPAWTRDGGAYQPGLQVVVNDGRLAEHIEAMAKDAADDYLERLNLCVQNDGAWSTAWGPAPWQAEHKGPCRADTVGGIADFLRNRAA